MSGWREGLPCSEESGGTGRAEPRAAHCTCGALGWVWLSHPIPSHPVPSRPLLRPAHTHTQPSSSLPVLLLLLLPLPPHDARCRSSWEAAAGPPPPPSPPHGPVEMLRGRHRCSAGGECGMGPGERTGASALRGPPEGAAPGRGHGCRRPSPRFRAPCVGVLLQIISLWLCDAGKNGV